MKKLLRSVRVGLVVGIVAVSWYIPVLAATEPRIFLAGNNYTRAEFLDRQISRSISADKEFINSEFDRILRVQTEHFLAIGGSVTAETQVQPTETNIQETQVQQAPTVEETRSSMTLPNRRLTEEELNIWIEEYYSLGGASDFELEVVRLINIERAKEGLQPLELSPALMKVARFKSQEMIDLQYFSHNSPVYNTRNSEAGIFRVDINNGISIEEMFGHENQRFIETGQGSLTGSGENLLGGVTTPESTLQAWLNSPGHRRAIMDENARTIGMVLGNEFFRATTSRGEEFIMYGATTANFGF